MKADLRADADHLQRLIHVTPRHAHVAVRAHGAHLLIELAVALAREPVARATRLAPGHFGLSFRSHTGRWEPLPVAGDLVEIARALSEELGAYLDPANL